MHGCYYFLLLQQARPYLYKDSLSKFGTSRTSSISGDAVSSKIANLFVLYSVVCACVYLCVFMSALSIYLGTYLCVAIGLYDNI